MSRGAGARAVAGKGPAAGAGWKWVCKSGHTNPPGDRATASVCSRVSVVECARDAALRTARFGSATQVATVVAALVPAFLACCGRPYRGRAGISSLVKGDATRLLVYRAFRRGLLLALCCIRSFPTICTAESVPSSCLVTKLFRPLVEDHRSNPLKTRERSDTQASSAILMASSPSWRTGDPSLVNARSRVR